MKLNKIFPALFLAPVVAVAQTPSTPAKTPAPSAPIIPIETNALRKPKLVTHGDLFIRNARILTVSHGTIEHGDLLVHGGKIVAVGKLKAPDGIPMIDATGKVVSPGIVDAHVHRGIDSTNEGTDAIVAEGRIRDVLNPDAKNVWQAVASGETTAMILHGSANPIGAESQVIKLKYGHPVADLPVPYAPRMIKFALGENVTRSGQDDSTRFPHTRMGVEAVYRRAFTQAREYNKKWADYEAKKVTDPNAMPPQRDLRLETLGDILKRKVWVQCHSYRADEILMLLRVSQDFGFKIGAFQHALESYKIAPELAKAGVGVSIFADDWAAKLELFDAIPYAPAILLRAGVNVSVNTDGTSGTTAINLDAAKAMRFGGLTEQQALALITINPAKELGVDTHVGSIDVGKDADLVIWDGHPLSTYSRVNTTIIEGEVLFQRRDAFGVNSASTIKSKVNPVPYVAHPSLPASSPTYAIMGGTVYPVSSAPIPNGMVIVQNGKIKAVGVKGSIPLPAGAVTVDAKGKNVYPGFIDAGTQLGEVEFGQVGQATDSRELGTNEPDLVALTAVNTQSEHFPTTLTEGVTSALTKPSGGAISGQASVLNTSGWTNELKGVKARAGLCINWPGGFGRGGDTDEDMVGDDYDDDGNFIDRSMGGAQGFGGGGGGSSTINDIQAYFDQAIKYGRGHDSVDLRMEAMQPYLTGKLPVFLRVRDRAGIVAAVEFVKKNKLKAVIVGAPDCWKEAKLLADNKIPVILTAAGKSTLDANTVPNDWDPYDTPYVTPALLKRAGVAFCFQTDSYSDVKDLPQRAAESCAYGLSPADLLRSLTLSAAEILGVSDKLGSITPGKVANLVISEGDPFEMSGAIRYVFVNGQPIPLTSKFTRLRDQYIQRIR